MSFIEETQRFLCGLVIVHDCLPHQHTTPFLQAMYWFYYTTLYSIVLLPALVLVIALNPACSINECRASFSYYINNLRSACYSSTIHQSNHCLNRQIPYRWKISRDVIFAKNLKTRFSCLFVRESTPTIREYPGILV